MQIDRNLAAKIGQKTIHILSDCHYQTTSGLDADIREALDKAISGTISYPSGVGVPEPEPGALTTQYKGVFTQVVFAITDWPDERWFIGSFLQAFG